MADIKRVIVIFLLAVSKISAQTQSRNGSTDLLNLFGGAFGGRDGENLLTRFSNLLSGGRGKNYSSESLGAFFRDSVFDNLVKKAYELNSGLKVIQHKTKEFAYDMDRIQRTLDGGGSPAQVLSLLRQREIPEELLTQDRMLQNLNKNFTKFVGGMRALRAAFSNEEGLGDTLKELISQSGVADAQGSGESESYQ